MNNIKISFSFCLCLIFCAATAHAQSTAEPVITGYLSTSGCPAGKTSCFVQYGSNGSISGNVSNASSGVAPTSTNVGVASWNYGFNGTSWDQLQVDASKFLKVNCATGCSSATPFTPIAPTVLITAGPTSVNAAFTTGGTVLQVKNTGTIPATFNLGTSSSVTASGTSQPILPGETIPVAVGANTYIAVLAYPTSGNTIIAVTSGTGQGYSNANGGSISVPNCGDVAIGCQLDLPWSGTPGSTPATLIGLLQAMLASSSGAIPAGTNYIGDVKPAVNTPAACTATTIVTGGTSVTVVTGPVHGGYLVNPANTASQGVTAENAYIDPVGTPGSTDSTANGTTVLLTPAQTFNIPPLATGQLIKANAATSGHKLTCVVW